MGKQSFPKQARLLKGADFDRVLRRRCSSADPFLVVYADQNELGRPRLGLTVSRRHGNAVVRNRWKRLLREAFRISQHKLPPSIDMVVLLRRGVEPDLQQLRQSIISVAWKAARKLGRGPT